MIRRREFLAGAAASALAGCQGSGPKKPNILFLMPDQFRGMDIAAMGNPDVQTPNIDRLAGEGVLLRNTIANCPVCCPARGTLLTGQFANQHGVDVNDARLPDEAVSLPELLKPHGYRTGFVGKWHLEGGMRLPGFVPPGPRRQGFDFWAANICSHDYWNMHYFRDDPTPIAMDDYSAKFFTDEAINFLNQGRGEAEQDDSPFCLYLQWGPPHNPYVAPPEYMNLYDPDLITVRDNWRENTPRAGRDDIAGYYAAITFIDNEIGRLLAVLEETGQADNTIILLSSDHGDMLGSHGTVLKRKPWEESIHVPGIVRYPGAIPAGGRSDLLFSHVDIVPTLLGLAGVPVPAHMTGRDLSANLRGVAGSEEPESVYIQSYTETESAEFPAWRGVRTKTHTFARHEQQAWVFYDNRADPYQMVNLAGKPDLSELQSTLDAMTWEWFAIAGDDWRVRNDPPYR